MSENNKKITRHIKEDSPKLGEQLKTSWWLAVLLAVPLSIMANLLTPPIHNWLSDRSTEQAIERLTDLEKEYSEVSKYASNKPAFNSYLLSVVIKSALYLAFIMIINRLLSYAASFIDAPESALNKNKTFLTLHTLYALISIVGLLLIFNLCNSAQKMYDNVEQYGNYSMSVKSEISRLRKIDK